MTSPSPQEKATDTGPAPAAPKARLGRTVALVLLLSVFWLLLSGRIGLQYFIFMVCSVGLVVWMNPERPFDKSATSRHSGAGGQVRGTLALGRYLAWLVWNVIKANFDVAYRILAPSMPIRPRLLVFDIDLDSEVARALIANSITLTPGTVTIDLDDHTYLVHAIHPDASEAVTSGELQNVVAPIFGEGPLDTPDLVWGSRPEDVLPRGSRALPRVAQKGADQDVPSNRDEVIS